MAASRVAVFLDYQNVHLTAHGLFIPHGTPVHDALVHPLRADAPWCHFLGQQEFDEVRDQAIYLPKP